MFFCLFYLIYAFVMFTGSGKSYLAKMLRDIEVENGGDTPRIHSMDDYFMTEVEKVYCFQNSFFGVHIEPLLVFSCLVLDIIHITWYTLEYVYQMGNGDPIIETCFILSLAFEHY